MIQFWILECLFNSLVVFFVVEGLGGDMEGLAIVSLHRRLESFALTTEEPYIDIWWLTTLGTTAENKS